MGSAMIKYVPGQDVGPLEPWPLDNPASDCRIIKGAPETFGRIDTGGPGHITRFGIWRCTAGAFECTEQGDELMTVLEGFCRVSDHATGQLYELGPGQSLFLKDGSRVTWDVPEGVTKVFFAYKAAGY